MNALQKYMKSAPKALAKVRVQNNIKGVPRMSGGISRRQKCMERPWAILFRLAHFRKVLGALSTDVCKSLLTPARHYNVFQGSLTSGNEVGL